MKMIKPRVCDWPEVELGDFCGFAYGKSLPLDLQRCFAAVVEAVERQKARQPTHLAELDTLFAALQQWAFTGEL